MESQNEVLHQEIAYTIKFPNPDQVPKFQFKEVPTAAISDEEEIQGHFTESSGPSLKSTSKDFSEADWIDRKSVV